MGIKIDSNQSYLYHWGIPPVFPTTAQGKAQTSVSDSVFIALVQQTVNFDSD